MPSLADLKKNKEKNLQKLREQAQKLSGQSQNNDNDNEWRLTLDKSGNGSALIRFLPTPKVDGEDGTPWVRVYSYGFKNPETNRWYIENSPTTFGYEHKDPVAEENSRLWNTGIESNKAIARSRKRRVNYWSNILVIKDKENPENNGKVFLFRYGPKIYEKIQKIMFPPEDDITGAVSNDPFDFWTGQNFVLDAKTKIIDNKKLPNYDDSKFLPPSPISEDDEEIERIWNECHSLQEILDPKNFKSYDELKRKFEQVMGGSAPTETSSSSTAEEDEIDALVSKAAQSQEARKPSVNAKKQEETADDDEIDIDSLLND